MDLNELQSVRDRERQTDKLQQLRESFYADAGEFIQQLHAERDRAVERAEDPFDSPEVRQLSDEIQTAEQTVEAIYEKRVGKIVKAASFAAADLPAEVDGMTAEEQMLFDDLVGNIKGNRQRVLDLLDGEDSGPPTGSSSSSEPAADAAHGSPATGDIPAQSSPQDTDNGPSPPPAEPNPSAPGQDEQTSGNRPTDAGGEDVTAADVMGGREGSAPPTQSSRETDSTGVDASSSSEGDSAPPSGTEGTPPSPETEGAPPSAEPVDPPVRKDGGQDPAVTENRSTGSTTAASGSQEVERQRVQILDDVETFLGFDDRDYDLEPDDVVSLPATNADILLERGVAREL